MVPQVDHKYFTIGCISLRYTSLESIWDFMTYFTIPKSLKILTFCFAIPIFRTPLASLIALSDPSYIFHCRTNGDRKISQIL